MRLEDEGKDARAAGHGEKPCSTGGAAATKRRLPAGPRKVGDHGGGSTRGTRWRRDGKPRGHSPDGAGREGRAGAPGHTEGERVRSHPGNTGATRTPHVTAGVP